LFGKLSNGGRVTIDVDDKDQVKLEVAQSAQQPPEPVEST
jgi:ATP-dependent Clp protease ATP-binding subunit ClpA